MAFTYILECIDGTYYTGSTKDLVRRLSEHQEGLGANYTRKRLPIKLVYYEKFDRIDTAFEREKQIQNWGHKKKKSLIESNYTLLKELSECQNESNYKIAIK